jgi:anti-sigma regulatory factor (Ser/Thr protein kinase)
MRFPPAIASVGIARRFVRESLEGWPQPVVDDAVLMTSELVTNAIVHGGTRGEISISARLGGLRVAVRDESKLLPVEKSGGLRDTDGRGLVVVSELADKWGVIEYVRGKSVWFTLRG